MLESITKDISFRKSVQNYGAFIWCSICCTNLEDLKVLRRSPDLLNNVTIGQGQLQLIMEQILFYHIDGIADILVK